MRRSQQTRLRLSLVILKRQVKFDAVFIFTCCACCVLGFYVFYVYTNWLIFMKFVYLCFRSMLEALSISTKLNSIPKPQKTSLWYRIVPKDKNTCINKFNYDCGIDYLRTSNSR